MLQIDPKKVSDEQHDLMKLAIRLAIECGCCVFPGAGKAAPKGFHWTRESSKDVYAIKDMPWHLAESVSIHLGKSDVVVLDVDSKEALAKVVKEGFFDLTTTYEDTSAPGKKHFVYRAPIGFEQGSVAPWQDKLDILGGVRIIKCHNPEQLLASWQQMKPWPLTERVGANKKEVDETPFSLPEGQEFHEGQRNTGLYRILSSYLAGTPNITYDLLKIVADKYNTENCKPPLSEGEVRSTVVSIMGRSVNENEPIKQEDYLRVRSIGEMLSWPAPDYLIENYLPVGGIMAIGAAPSAGKSFLVLDWALKIATGEPIRGRRTLQSPVIYIALEGEAGVPNRIKGAMDRMGIDDLPPERFGIVTHPKTGIFSDLPELERQAENMIKLGIHKPVIILDTLAAAYPGIKESDSGVMQQAIDILRRFTRKIEGTFIFLHHSPHGQQRLRGSTAIIGACDCITFIHERKVFTQKVKDGIAIPSYNIDIKQVDLARLDRLGNQMVTAVIEELEPDPKNWLTKPQKKLLEDIKSAIKQGFEPTVEKLAKSINPEKKTRVRNRFIELAKTGAITITTEMGVEVLTVEKE